MDVKSGMAVGFVTALGAIGGGFVGLMLSEMTRSRHPNTMMAFGSTGGALVGAFVAGTFVANPFEQTGSGTSAQQQQAQLNFSQVPMTISPVRSPRGYPELQMAGYPSTGKSLPPSV